MLALARSLPKSKAKGARMKTKTTIKPRKAETKSQHKVRNQDTNLRLDQEKLERAEIRFMFWIIQYLKRHPEALYESSEGPEIELRNLTTKT